MKTSGTSSKVMTVLLILLGLGGWVLFFSQTSSGPSDKQSDALLRRAFDKIVNEKNTGGEFDQFIGEKFLEGEPLTPLGREAFKISTQKSFKKIPDLHGQILSTVSNGHFISAIIFWSGTSEAESGGGKAKPVKLSGRTSEIYGIENGKIMSRQILVDTFLPEKNRASK